MILGPLNADFDGDEIYMCSIKESGMVLDMQGIHPSTCMIGANELQLTGDIDITIQQHVALTSWINEYAD